ncbi:TonB-dependent receptor [Pseudoalteromonas sp. H105]|uniref:TonB-dependent receptor n=1 Tax=Pseudoalteromonas sp. H105 TaxID=1348393 RepID=UPI0007322E34|nr:TonB-dependent receptor [Pseudoalteromonas sp. H105]KTF18234.1 hypothetical protein ATS75_02135 [Pseudoalteromonas sp. H105]
MNKTGTYISLLVTSLWILPQHAVCDEQELIFDLSIEELLEINITVASSKLEKLTDAPAIISRYNRLDLEKMGITTLREMFNFIPGVIVQDSLGGWASVQIRGIDEAFNQKVLFLLDGVPYHQPSHSSIPMEGVPWEAISHVEVIRGPGAVFFGSQASGGVFNVVTKKQSETNTASIKAGSHGMLEASGYAIKEISDTQSIYAAVETRNEDGYHSTYHLNFPDVGEITDDVQRELTKQSALVRYINKNLVVQLHAFSDKTIGMNDSYTDENTLQPLTLKTEGYLVHIENSWQLDQSRFATFIDYNFYTLSIRLNNLFGPGVDAIAKKDNGGKDDFRLRYGGSWAYNFNESFDFVAGIENETRSRDSYRIYAFDSQKDPLVNLMDKGKTDEFSAYTQLDYNYQNWRFLIGARFTDNEFSGKKTTPRAAIVYQLDEHQSLKALYSTGFNSPNPTQTSISLPGNLEGNQNLTAEIVQTYDIAYSYSNASMLFVANAYYLKADDFIQKRYSESLNAISFFNERSFERKGVELDFQKATDLGKLFVNLAYQFDGNEIKTNDAAAIKTPKLTVSAGAYANFWENHSLGMEISYIGERQDINGYSVVNTNYTARFENVDFFVVIRNVFDQEIQNPDTLSLTSPLVARGVEGVNTQLGVRFKF